MFFCFWKGLLTLISMIELDHGVGFGFWTCFWIERRHVGSLDKRNEIKSCEGVAVGWGLWNRCLGFGILT